MLTGLGTGAGAPLGHSGTSVSANSLLSTVLVSMSMAMLQLSRLYQGNTESPVPQGFPVGPSLLTEATCQKSKLHDGLIHSVPKWHWSFLLHVVEWRVSSVQGPTP